jgi:glyoxylase-like metal-dependent hydrolase (beta-lactamase superfamily II)
VRRITRIVLSIAILASVLARPGLAGAQPDGFLKASGTRIVDGAGRDVLLRGMGLGGWMLQEGYMIGLKKEGTQHSIRARIQDLIGKDDTERFYQQWRQNHMTRADVDRLGASGFNSIRLPMHYNLFTLPIEQEPVKGADTWLPTGFDMVDQLLAWCRANRIYLILDLHAAPGGQGKDANISDYDPAKPSLWESDENRRKTVALWRKLAERYGHDPWIGGYDILNEPNWTFEGKDKNGREDVGNQPIWDFYKAITKAIRQVDQRHLIIIEGNGWGNNYNGLPEAWDANLVMSFHKYWNPNTEETISKFLALRDRYRMPLWLGESGENTNEWFRECVTLVEKHGIGWAWWPYKKVGNPRCIQTVTAPDDFTTVVAYWNGEGARPAADVARRAIFALADSLKIDRCHFNEDVALALIPGGRAPAAPSASNYRVDPLAPGLWRVQAVSGTLSTAYVIAGSRAALLIDTCTGQEGLDTVVTSLVGALPVTVALTHGHGDHSGGIRYFPKVLVHPDDADLLPKGATVERGPLAEGMTFDLGGKTIEVLAIPGHTPGSVAFLDRAGRYMMTGDGVGSTMVWMQISKLPLTTYLESVKRLEALKGLIGTLYVGHHEQELVTLTPQYITDMRIVTEQVLAGAIESTPYEMGTRSGRSATYGSARLIFSPDRLRAPK